MTCKHCGRMDPYSASCDVCEKPKPPPPCDRCGKSECVCNLHPSETAPSEPNYDHMSTQLKPTPERRIACPKCEGANILVERRPNGNCACVDCAHIWPTALSYKFKSAPECPGGDKHWMDPSIGGFSSCVKCGHTEYPDDRPAKESGGREWRATRIQHVLTVKNHPTGAETQDTFKKPVHVIEYSAFEQMKRSRDKWIKHYENITGQFIDKCVAEETLTRRVAELEGKLAAAARDVADAVSGCCDCPMFKAAGKENAALREMAEKSEVLAEIRKAHMEVLTKDLNRALAAVEKLKEQRNIYHTICAENDLTKQTYASLEAEIARILKGESNAGEG